MLAQPAMGDAATQVGLGVGGVNLHGRGAVGERLAVLLELEMAHAAVRVDYRVVLLQSQCVSVRLDRLAVLARLVLLVALGLFVERTALNLRRTRRYGN